MTSRIRPLVGLVEATRASLRVRRASVARFSGASAGDPSRAAPASPRTSTAKRVDRGCVLVTVRSSAARIRDERAASCVVTRAHMRNRHGVGRVRRTASRRTRRDAWPSTRSGTRRDALEGRERELRRGRLWTRTRGARLLVLRAKTSPTCVVARARGGALANEAPPRDAAATSRHPWQRGHARGESSGPFASAPRSARIEGKRSVGSARAAPRSAHQAALHPTGSRTHGVVAGDERRDVGALERSLAVDASYSVRGKSVLVGPLVATSLQATRAPCRPASRSARRPRQLSSSVATPARSSRLSQLRAARRSR